MVKIYVTHLLLVVNMVCGFCFDGWEAVLELIGHMSGDKSLDISCAGLENKEQVDGSKHRR